MAHEETRCSGRFRRLRRMLCDRNFYGLWHQLLRALGFRGMVSVPVMPAPKTQTRIEDDDIVLRGTPQRVIFFSHDLNLEGASISLFELIVGLQKKGVVDPEVIALEDGPVRQRYEAAGIPVSVFSYDPDKLSTVVRLGQSVRALADVIRQRAPSVIVANTLRSFLPILAAKESRVPSIWIIRESAPWDAFFRYLPDPVAHCAIGAICLAQRVIFVSHASRKVWDRFDQYGNFKVIPNGIDFSRFQRTEDPCRKKQAKISLGLKEDAAVILCVGTINARKGQRDLIEAAAHLPQTVLEHLQVLFVGDARDPYAKKLRQCYQALSAPFRERVRFFPPTESIHRFYEAADIFVLCSREESFPRVTLEAMGFGLPIITTPVHGVREQMVEGENAFFYEPENNKDLGRKIECLVEDEMLRSRMGQNSLQRLSRLTTFEEMTNAYADEILAAVQRRSCL